MPHGGNFGSSRSRREEEGMGGEKGRGRSRKKQTRPRAEAFIHSANGASLLARMTMGLSLARRGIFRHPSSFSL